MWIVMTSDVCFLIPTLMVWTYWKKLIIHYFLKNFVHHRHHRAFDSSLHLVLVSKRFGSLWLKYNKTIKSHSNLTRFVCIASNFIKKCKEKQKSCYELEKILVFHMNPVRLFLLDEIFVFWLDLVLWSWVVSLMNWGSRLLLQKHYLEILNSPNPNPDHSFLKKQKITNPSATMQKKI